MGKPIRAVVAAVFAIGIVAAGISEGGAHAVPEKGTLTMGEGGGDEGLVVEATPAPDGVAPLADYCAADTPARNTWVTVCVEGRRIWVKDNEADGQSAFGDYIHPNTSNFPACKNSLGAGRWGYCSYSRIGNNQLVHYEAWTRRGGGNEKNHRTTGSGFVVY